MAAKSKMEIFRGEIEDLINRGASIRSTWRVINSHLPKEANISYNAFFHFVKTHIKMQKADNLTYKANIKK